MYCFIVLPDCGFFSPPWAAGTPLPPNTQLACWVHYAQKQELEKVSTPVDIRRAVSPTVMASPSSSRAASQRSPLGVPASSSSPGSDRGSTFGDGTEASASQLQQHKTDLITGAMPPTSITAGQLETLKKRFDEVRCSQQRR